MSVTATYSFKLQVEELLSETTRLAQTVQKTETSLTELSTPPASAQAGGSRQLVAGVDTIDLTAVANQAGAAVDLTGLKVQTVYIKASEDNSEPIVFAPGASNGYHLFGDADGQVTLGPGAMQLFIRNDDLPDVGASAKQIDVSSVDADAEYEIILVAG